MCVNARDAIGTTATVPQMITRWRRGVEEIRDAYEHTLWIQPFSASARRDLISAMASLARPHPIFPHAGRPRGREN